VLLNFNDLEFQPNVDFDLILAVSSFGNPFRHGKYSQRDPKDLDLDPTKVLLFGKIEDQIQFGDIVERETLLEDLNLNLLTTENCYGIP